MTQPNPWKEWNDTIAAMEDMRRQAEDAIIAEIQRRDALAGYTRRAGEQQIADLVERFPALHGRVAPGQTKARVKSDG